ncbi:MAG: hypothetical protein AAF297_12200, partial [Planctomycetota bacterium]
VGTVEGLLDRLDGVMPGAADVRGEDALSGFMMAMGVGIIVVVLLRRLRKRARLRQPVGEPQERIEEIREDAERRARKEDIATDLEDMARRFAAVLDNKAMRLELLIAQADESAARLERSGGGLAAVGAVGGADDSEPGDSVSERSSEHRFAPASDDQHAGVYGLADEGLDPVAIAQKLGKPVGEVELILALRAG